MRLKLAERVSERGEREKEREGAKEYKAVIQQSGNNSKGREGERERERKRERGGVDEKKQSHEKRVLAPNRIASRRNREMKMKYEKYEERKENEKGKEVLTMRKKRRG